MPRPQDEQLHRLAFLSDDIEVDVQVVAAVDSELPPVPFRHELSNRLHPGPYRELDPKGKGGGFREMPRSLTRPDKPVRIREALGIGFGLVLVFGLSTVVLADRLALPTGDLLADAAIWLSLQIAVIGGAIALAGVLRARRLAGSEAPDPFSVRSALGLVISFGLGVSMIAMASSMLLSSPTTFAGWVLVVLGGALAALPVFMLVRHARGARGGASR